MLLAENKLRKVKWTTEIFVLSNISTMCTEMTKTYDIIIGLPQLLDMCKVEKTQLNDRVATGGGGGRGLCSTNCCSTNDRNFILYNQYK